jgi:hypothetical protein
MKHAIYFISILIVFSACGQEKIDPLTVEETVRIAKNSVPASLTLDEYKIRLRGNADARPKLYEILTDPLQKKHWPAVVNYFFYIGNQDDIDKLIGLYDKEEGVLGFPHIQMATQTFFSIGGMSARGVTGSRHKLEEMITAEYWKSKKYRLYPENATELSYEYESIRIVLIRAVLGFGDDYPQVVENVIARIPDERQRELMRAGLKSMLDASESRKNSPLVQALNWKQGRLAKVDTPKIETKDVKKEIPATASSVDDISRLVAQAIDAYDRISGAFILQEYEKSVLWFAKGEDPLFPLGGVRNEESIKKFMEEFNQRCTPAVKDATANMAKDIKSGKLTYGPAEVGMTSTTKFIELERGSGKYGPITMKTTTVVRIPIAGSESIGQKYLPAQISPRCRSVSENKGLVIMMIKIGDDWYWNPFGW